jgi:MoaA/NifB/PqqE/SkfB family radical SAM enzyme
MGIEKTCHFMTFETLQKIIQDLKNTSWKFKILMAGHGEPTLNPNYLDFIAYIRKELPEVPIHIMTNGYSIKRDPQHIDWMFYAGITNLILDEYADNPIRDYLSSRGIPFEINGDKGVKLFTDKPRVLINPPIEVSKISGNRGMTNHCGAGMPPLKTPKKARCTKVFREIYVRWDGNIALCCDDFRGEYGIENIHNMSIEEIWMHPRFESARKFLYQGSRCFHPCSVCATSPIRPGLLPDRMGKEDFPEPTEQDWNIVSYRTEPYAKIVRRDYEHNT